METQIGNLESADLEKGTLTICVGDDIEAVAGHYAVVPIAEYTRLNNIANKQLETEASDICHSISDSISFGFKFQEIISSYDEAQIRLSGDWWPICEFELECGLMKVDIMGKIELYQISDCNDVRINGVVYTIDDMCE